MYNFNSLHVGVVMITCTCGQLDIVCAETVLVEVGTHKS